MISIADSLNCNLGVVKLAESLSLKCAEIAIEHGAMINGIRKSVYVQILMQALLLALPRIYDRVFGFQIEKIYVERCMVRTVCL